MNLTAVVDFADQAHSDIGRYMLESTLSPEKLAFRDFPVGRLDWDSVAYEDSDLSRVPNDRKGVYAFTIRRDSDVLPPHGYVLYIGAAGLGSDRSLRDRYSDYRTQQKILRRPKVARMIGTWHKVLHFAFAPLEEDLTDDQLRSLERQLNTALMPPFSRRDVEAEVRRQREAF